MGKLDSNDPRPPYLQVADTLLESVLSGEYSPGAQLPALSDLAEGFTVATGTVRRALAVLAERGVVVTRQGTGTFVRTDLDVNSLQAPKRYQSRTDAELAQLADRVAKLEQTVASLQERLESR